jgi:hypothetical protein
MTTYSDAEANGRLDSVLERATVEGEVRIRRSDGEEFIVRPAHRRRSPLDVGHIDAQLTADEIVQFVRESRERGGEPR